MNAPYEKLRKIAAICGAELDGKPSITEIAERCWEAGYEQGQADAGEKRRIAPMFSDPVAGPACSVCTTIMTGARCPNCGDTP